MPSRPVLLASLLALCAGCASAPLQFSGKHIAAADLAFVVRGKTTRAEFDAKLGKTLFGPATRIELLCVAYDGNGRVAKWGILAQPEKRTTKEVAAAWLASGKAVSP